MMASNRITIVLALATVVLTGFAFHVAAEDIPPDPDGGPRDAARPLKVFILAGQSNMQGSAHNRTFAAIGDDPKTAGLLGEILDQNGDPIVCDNAWITYLTGGRDGDTVLHGKVKVGYLGSGKTFVRFGKALAEATLQMQKK